jgi:hypothetical protein
MGEKPEADIIPDEIELAPEIIKAGVQAYYENALWGWENPGLDDLKIMLREVYRAMAKADAIPRR